MLAFKPGLAISYDLTDTGWSLVIAVVGACLGFRVALSRLPAVRRVVGGATLLTASIGGMHYVGVAAMRLQGRFTLDHQQVALSLVASWVLAAAALAVLSGIGSFPRRVLLSQVLLTVLLSLAICLLHFAGMSAMTLHLGLGPAVHGAVLGSQTLAIAVGSASVALLLISLSVSVMDRHLSQRSAREEVRLREIAHHDALTGVANRVLLDLELARVLQQAQGNGSSAAILCLDLDRFKAINDLLGHAAGDKLLVATARRISGLLRRGDVLARLGADEFAILLAEAGDGAHYVAVAERIAAAISEPFFVDDQRMSIGASIGVAIYPEDGPTGEELLRRADIALHRAKEEGRGGMRLFAPDMDLELQQRRTLERDLQVAIGEEALEVYYQPLVACGGGEVEGYEALLRWQHPTRGMVPPSQFIPIAEESGLIIPLGRWVLDQACRTASRWETPLRMAVNLSPTQFKQGNLVGQIASALAENGLAASRLELEVTEGVLIDNPARAVAILSELRALGVRVSLDDFGTGFSSLSYLRVFPLDKIKIDRSFITNLGRDAKSAAIVRSIVMLAHSLDLSVTAEGVETTEQLAILQAQACNQVQGYLFGRPARLTDLVIPSLTADGRASVPPVAEQAARLELASIAAE